MCQFCKKNGFHGLVVPHAEEKCMMRSSSSCHRCGRRGHFASGCHMRPMVFMKDEDMPIATTPVEGLKETLLIPNDNSIFRSYLTHYEQKLQGRETKNKQAVEGYARSLGVERIYYIEPPKDGEK